MLKGPWNEIENFQMLLNQLKLSMKKYLYVLFCLLFVFLKSGKVYLHIAILYLFIP